MDGCTSIWKLKLAPFLVFYRKLPQELSYRKQIARQLRTQFVEGITVTFKSTLRVTQGHWTDFKHAVVRPLLKKSGLDVGDTKNYRPV